jgi:hypothetical protein
MGHSCYLWVKSKLLNMVHQDFGGPILHTPLAQASPYMMTMPQQFSIIFSSPKKLLLSLSIPTQLLPYPEHFHHLLLTLILIYTSHLSTVHHPHLWFRFPKYQLPV